MLDFDQLSYWEKETYTNHTDFLVVGSGIVGLSAAIHYKQRYPHQKVTVIERGYLPTGASTKNAGFACIGSPSELLDDLKQQSETIVFSLLEKRWRGLNYLRELIGDKALDYQENGSHELFSTTEKKVYDECIENIPSLNKRLKEITGDSSVFNIDQEIIQKSKFNGFNFAISHAAEGQINTGMMMKALIKLANQLDINLLTGIEAKSVTKQILETDKGPVKFERCAICTNGFFKSLFPSENVEPARAQVIITKPIKELKFNGIFHFDRGYYYFRAINNRVLFGGGRELALHEENTSIIENTSLITTELNRILSKKILPNTPFEVDYSWAGIMGVGKSKTPLIKQLDTNVYCAVKLGGMGVAIGTFAAKELIELMD